ncbi:MAG: FxsA family protein [Lysinibacillus sp.]
MKKFFISFVVYMLIEMALLIFIGQQIGVFNTLLLVVATTILGIYFAKNKGMKSVQKVKSSLERGEAPGPAMVDAMMSFMGGLLLVIPGFLTDAVGLLLLFSFTKKLFKPIIYLWMRKKMKNGQFVIVQR